MKYVLVTSDPAEADRDKLYLSYSRRDPDYGNRWNDGLTETITNLTGFPGPLSHARDEAASELYRREVRRLLYYGPTRRRTGIPTCIFTPSCHLPPMTRWKLPSR